MVFADIEGRDDVLAFHHELAAFLRTRFPDVQAGFQVDSWITVAEGGQRVSIDTFTSTAHQVKSARACELVQRVVAALQRQYVVSVREPPALEEHEEV